LIFGYSLAEAKKAVVSTIALIGALLAFVLSDYDPSVTDGFVALAGALAGVFGVFLAKNHTEEDLSKAVAQLQGAALSVAGYFVTVQPGTVEKITILTGAAVSVIAVYWLRNDMAYAGLEGPGPAAVPAADPPGVPEAGPAK
jgi:hypothetical protein